MTKDTKITFRCDLCGKTFEEEAQCLKHEANHKSPISYHPGYYAGEKDGYPSWIKVEFDDGTTITYSNCNNCDEY